MSEKIDLFEIASREKYRFDGGSRGPLTVEHLWSIPLTGANSIDAVAVGLHNELQNVQTTSFVNKTTSANLTAQRKFELVKYIIAVRLAEKEAAVKAEEKASLRRQLREAIAAKEQESLLSGDVAALKQKLAELDN